MTSAGNNISHYQSIVKTYEITKLDKNVKFTVESNECLVFKLFLMSETIWYLLATGPPCGTHGSTPKQ